MLCQIHDPNDPNICCFRGAKFIEDKHMKEAIMQYNLKNPGPPPAPKDEDQNKSLPSQPSFTKPRVNSMAVTFKHSDQTQKQYEEEEESTIQAINKELEQNQAMKELHQPAINMFQSQCIKEIKTDQMQSHM